MKLQNFIRLDGMDAWSSQMTKQTKSAIHEFIENVHSMYIWESIQHSTFLDETNSVEKKNILWNFPISVPLKKSKKYSS
jgi:hypothetical protein